jgi:hypothetical protein
MPNYGQCWVLLSWWQLPIILSCVHSFVTYHLCLHFPGRQNHSVTTRSLLHADGVSVGTCCHVSLQNESWTQTSDVIQTINVVSRRVKMSVDIKHRNDKLVTKHKWSSDLYSGYFRSTAQMSPLVRAQSTLNDIKMMFFLQVCHRLLPCPSCAFLTE